VPRFALFFDLPLPLNRAGFSDLTMLPGIGPGLAGKILRYRKHHGSFSGLDDLENVRGIGPALASRLRPLVCFD
jgi:competence protein ComEA